MTDLERQLERQLLDHARSVRSLASALLADDAAGQDIAKETLLAIGPQVSLESGSTCANTRLPVPLPT